MRGALFECEQNATATPTEAGHVPYPMTRITKMIMTQTMMPAKKRSRTMKIKLTTMAITRPLKRGGHSAQHFMHIVGSQHELAEVQRSSTLSITNEQQSVVNIHNVYLMCKQINWSWFSENLNHIDLQQNPVPWPSVVLKDSHGHLPRFNDHIRFPVAKGNGFKTGTSCCGPLYELMYGVLSPDRSLLKKS